MKFFVDDQIITLSFRLTGPRLKSLTWWVMTKRLSLVKAISDLITKIYRPFFDRSSPSFRSAAATVFPLGDASKMLLRHTCTDMGAMGSTTTIMVKSTSAPKTPFLRYLGPDQRMSLPVAYGSPMRPWQRIFLVRLSIGKTIVGLRINAQLQLSRMARPAVPSLVPAIAAATPPT